jgi:hypothetical protein
VKRPADLREALACYLARRGITLRGWFVEQGWQRGPAPSSSYVAANRWLRGLVDSRTGAAYSLPILVRAEIAEAIGYSGSIFRPGERRSIPSSSRSSSQEGEEDRGSAEVSSLRSKRKKKSRRAASPDRTHLTSRRRK